MPSTAAATLSRAPDFDKLVKRFSGPTWIGEPPAKVRRPRSRSVTVRNQEDRPALPRARSTDARARASTAAPAPAQATAPAAMPASSPRAAAPDARTGGYRELFPATGIYDAHPMLRRIANLEARLTRAAWAEAEQADKAMSVASGFRYRACAAAPVAAASRGQAGLPRVPTPLDLQSDRAMEIAVWIHQARIACVQPVYPDRTWYREGLVRRALEQL